MARLDGKVAFITGAARGQGRSHALRMAEEGADIIGVDLCAPVDSVTAYDFPTMADLEETAAQVEALDRRCVIRQADVRSTEQLSKAVEAGVAELGHLDIVVANAGIFSLGAALEIDEQQWQDVIDINLTGVWKTVKAALPAIRERGKGGSVVLISSLAGSKGVPNTAHYSATKHAVIGLTKVFANEFAHEFIRFNCISPNSVDTPMIQNEATYKLFRPDLEHPKQSDVVDAFASLNALPIPFLDARDISNAVVYLASDEARYVTGTTHLVDAGALAPYKIPHG
jgi:SDR family mycofactocin-dependent oxidoreductase